MPRAAIYLRISRYSEDSTSISRQEQACRGRAESLGIEQVDLFSDIDRSGYDPTTERPGFNELMRNLHLYSHLIVYRIDRLTRQGARHLLTLVEDHLEPASTALVSATEDINTSGPYGELFLVLLSTFAKMESERISERITATQSYLREQGYWFSGSPPYGYRTITDEQGHKRLAQDGEEASHVLEAVQRTLHGDTFIDIAADYPMTHQGLRNLLTNPVLAGYQTDNGDIVLDDAGNPVMVTDNPIIDTSTHQRLVAALTDPSRSPRKKYLLSGILICDECGNRMAGANKRGYGQYVCHGCGGNVVSMSKVDEIVTNHVKSLLPTILAQGAEEESKQEHQPDNSKRAHLSHLLTQLDEKIDELIMNGMDFDSPQVKRLEARARRVQDELVAMTEPAPSSPIPSTFDISAFDDAPVNVQRTIISHVVSSIPIKKASSPGGRFDDARVVLPD